MIGRLRRFWQDESGGTVDTVIAVSAMVLIAGTALVIIRPKLVNLIGNVADMIGGLAGPMAP